MPDILSYLPLAAGSLVEQVEEIEERIHLDYANTRAIDHDEAGQLIVPLLPQIIAALRGRSDA